MKTRYQTLFNCVKKINGTSITKYANRKTPKYAINLELVDKTSVLFAFIEINILK